MTFENSPKKKAIIQAYPLFSHAQSNIPGGDAKPKNGAGSNCIKVQIINANFNIDKVEAIVWNNDFTSTCHSYNRLIYLFPLWDRMIHHFDFDFIFGVTLSNQLGVLINGVTVSEINFNIYNTHMNPYNMGDIILKCP